MILKAVTALVMLGLCPLFAVSLRRGLRERRVVIRGQYYTLETRPLTYWSTVVTDALGFSSASACCSSSASTPCFGDGPPRALTGLRPLTA